MNLVLDEMSYRLGLFLEREGFRAVPIVSSNIWRYRGYKDLKESFAPDMSHRHAAVAAGLADFGYSALALTPEYGARNRFVSVVTDAVLTPSPLLEPGSVCDRCMLCAKHCLSGALTQELNGMADIRIEDQTFHYMDKNLWRCAWGEHFDLDLDLPKPERVDEKVLIETYRQHGMRGGEMGSCLRYCVPAARRYFDKSYTNAPRRRRTPVWDAAGPDRGVEARLCALAAARGVDFVTIAPVADLQPLGIDANAFLPGAATAVTVGLHFNQPVADDASGGGRGYLLMATAYDLVREIERHGHDAVSMTDMPEATITASIGGGAGSKSASDTTPCPRMPHGTMPSK